MGSDLHMSPPTPDEQRLVRCGHVTAIYSRHTDSIHGDTKTWTRKHHIDDPEKQVLATAQVMWPDAKIVTIPEGYLIGKNGMPDELLYETLATSDRDWDQELREAHQKVLRAKQKVEQAADDYAAAMSALNQLEDERTRAGADAK